VCRPLTNTVGISRLFFNGKERRYESYTTCFHTAVVGSGVWVHIGEVYAANNIMWLTSMQNKRNATESERVHAFKRKGSGVAPTAVLQLRGGSLDVQLTGPPCANRTIRLGTCPPAAILRTGWHAQRPCACNENWDFLNCVGHSQLYEHGGNASEVPRPAPPRV